KSNRTIGAPGGGCFGTDLSESVMRIEPGPHVCYILYSGYYCTEPLFDVKPICEYRNYPG
ncbi:4089_t:CDS:1, partial [Ambispora gerdemannii]